MKVRMLAVLSALSLALWLPVRAQQASSAQTPQTQQTGQSPSERQIGPDFAQPALQSQFSDGRVT